MNSIGWVMAAFSAASTTRAAKPATASAGSSPTPEQSRDDRLGLYRRRLHRRAGSCQYADARRTANGADDRRAFRRSRSARGRRGGGFAQEPIDRARPCGVALARGGEMAARARGGPRAVQDLLDVRFYRRG